MQVSTLRRRELHVSLDTGANQTAPLRLLAQCRPAQPVAYGQPCCVARGDFRNEKKLLDTFPGKAEIESEDSFEIL